MDLPTTTSHEASTIHTGGIPSRNDGRPKNMDIFERAKLARASISPDSVPRETSATLRQGSKADEASSLSNQEEQDLEKGVLDEGAPSEELKECTCGYHPKNDLVEFDGPNDPGNPKNFPKWRKWLITTSMGLMTFAVTFSSSIFSVAVQPVAEEYGVSSVVATLGVALFLFVCYIHS